MNTAGNIGHRVVRVSRMLNNSFVAIANTEGDTAELEKAVSALEMEAKRVMELLPERPKFSYPAVHYPRGR